MNAEAHRDAADAPRGEDAGDAVAPQGDAPVNERREVFGWMMYDWACSVFNTTVVTTLLGPYLTDLAQRAVGRNGVVFALGPLPDITAESFFPLCVGLSVFLQVFLLPVLGAVADYSRLKKHMMAAFVYAAVVATCLLFFLTENTYVLGGVLFVAANLCFGAAMVFYNSFLPEITTEDRRDRVSSRGFALGYLGGGLLLAANLALITGAPRLGISTGLAVRLCLLSAGLWWGGFALVTFTRLRSRGAARPLPAGKSHLTVGFTELAGTFRELRRLPHTMRYLASYLFYNDGIQTVITMSAVLIEQELFKARGLEPDRAFLVGLVLVIQFSAIAGALLFERAAALVGTKRAILVSLALWSGVVVYAYAFLQTTAQAWVLGAIIAVVLGGSQALSRSLFSRMIPRGREASFFGIYEISERGTSWVGPIVFSLVISLTGSYRQAVLSLIVFFVVGMLGLYLTDTDRAIHDAGNRLPEEVPEEDK